MNMLPYIRLLRPVQWLKNLMLFFPPFLGGAIFQINGIGSILVPFASFSLLSSSCYILNDILDAPNDACHPYKKSRPIASGAVAIRMATAVAIALASAGIFLGLQVSRNFLFLLLLYGLISIIYSLKFKQYPIIDIFCISAGFILRLVAGGEAFSIVISEWLFLSVFLLSVFLSTGKRLSEKSMLGEDAGSHRQSLLSYPAGFLDGTMYMTGGAVLVTYTMFVIARHSMVYTVPLCCFGLLRYIFRVKSGFGGDPTDSLLKDAPLFGVGFLWAIMVGWVVYGR
jgi:decaprenyl-phosphate phosphoribosyltransferase